MLGTRKIELFTNIILAGDIEESRSNIVLFAFTESLEMCRACGNVKEEVKLMLIY